MFCCFYLLSTAVFIVTTSTIYGFAILETFFCILSAALPQLDRQLLHQKKL